VEFFLWFFELIGNDIMEAVEESRRSSSMVKSLNSTFIVFIPKADKPSNFGELRPISLCNLAYKIFTKIIVNKIKSFLSKSLSGEQLGFLKGRKILDAVGMTQKCLHNIKSKNMKALILKLDL
jgi:hypothetical protein